MGLIFMMQESLKNTLDEALRTNDEFTVYCKMLQIYSQAKKSQVCFSTTYLINLDFAIYYFYTFKKEVYAVLSIYTIVFRFLLSHTLKEM